VLLLKKRYSTSLESKENQLFIIAIVLLAIIVGGYFLFRDTMNRIQYLERLRLYWIIKDDGVKGTPVFTRGTFMRQTAEPYWRGRGFQVRIGTHTVQIGRLRMKVCSLEAQISRLGWLPTEPKLLRRWK
jgi:hypothetical protein